MNKNTGMKKSDLFRLVLCGLASLCAIGLSLVLIYSYNKTARELASVNQQLKEAREVAGSLNETKTEVQTARKHLKTGGEKGVKKDIETNSNYLPQKQERVEELSAEIRELEAALGSESQGEGSGGVSVDSGSD